MEPGIGANRNRVPVPSSTSGATGLACTPAPRPLRNERALSGFSIDHGAPTRLEREVGIAPEKAYRRSLESTSG